MNTHFSHLILMAAVCFPAIAQQPPSSATPTRSAEVTIRGCVTGGRRYTFTQASTGALFDLTGDVSQMASIEGKLVEITGNEFAPQPSSDELPKLRASKVQVVGERCPIQAGAGRHAAGAEAKPQGSAPASSPATTPYKDPGTVTQTPPNVNNPNIKGDTGAPSPGTGNPPQPHQ